MTHQPGKRRRLAAAVVRLAGALCVAAGCNGDATRPDPYPGPTNPPFSGTIFIDPDIITPSDPTTFLGLTYNGQASRTMFDRRVADWITVDAYVFDASFSDGLTAEVQVNPEFGSAAASQAMAEMR